MTIGFLTSGAIRNFGGRAFCHWTQDHDSAVVAWTTKAIDADALLAQADSAMYESKRTRCNGVTPFATDSRDAIPLVPGALPVETPRGSADKTNAHSSVIRGAAPPRCCGRSEDGGLGRRVAERNPSEPEPIAPDSRLGPTSPYGPFPSPPGASAAPAHSGGQP